MTNKKDLEQEKQSSFSKGMEACMNFFILTAISDMKHCIGLEKNNIKKGKYKAYRNYFNVGDTGSVIWSNLKKFGFADEFKENTFRLNKKGISFLENIFEIKIEG